MGTKLVSMKRTKKETKKEMEPMAVGESERYPWGLRVNLGTEELSKLSMDVNDVKIGSKIKVGGVGKVVELSKTDREGGKPNQRMEIQLTDVGLADGKKGKSDSLDWEAVSSKKSAKILEDKGFY